MNRLLFGIFLLLALGNKALGKKEWNLGLNRELNTQYEQKVLEDFNHERFLETIQDAEDEKAVADALFGDLGPSRFVLKDFFKWAISFLTGLRIKVCLASILFPLYKPLCEESSRLVEEGERFRALPDYYYANFLAMTLAYPSVFAYPDRDVLVVILFPTSLRIQPGVHRALGLGNAERMLGYSEEISNKVAWNSYSTMSKTDFIVTVPDDGGSLTTYCDYIEAEYETLKNFARGRGYTDLPPLLFNETGLMKQACETPRLGFLIRSDWEHHRRECVAAMMNEDNTYPVVMYTLWHWESLYLLYSELGVEQQEEQSYSEMFKSFDFFLDAM